MIDPAAAPAVQWAGAWPVERVVAGAGDHHARPLPEPAVRAVWVADVVRPAIALGSAQSMDVVDLERAAAAGVEVVRRRSGGGAVLLVPGEVVWIDVLVPRGDPLWLDDVGRASWWLGERWAAAVVELLGSGPGSSAAAGASGDDLMVAVHRGRLVQRPGSELVCFAGLGPGEVTVDGAKVVGISQRRTRDIARFQCAALVRWNPELLCEVLADPPALAELDSVARGVGATAAEVVEAFLAQLARV